MLRIGPIRHHLFGSRRVTKERSKTKSLGPPWLLRRTDQATVAVLVLIALASTVTWWISRGGLLGQLIEVDRAEQQTAAFELDPNTAEMPELIQLPGIGPALAGRIVESRRADGQFIDHNDLMRVRGIGPKTLDRIRPYLCPMPDAGSLAGR